MVSMTVVLFCNGTEKKIGHQLDAKSLPILNNLRKNAKNWPEEARVIW